MTETFEITATARSDSGKGASRRLRREGRVPGIVYGGHREPQMVSLLHTELLRHLEHEAFYSHVLELKLPGDTQQVILKDLQRHPARPFILHVDFQRISAGEKIRKIVPIHFLNESNCKGVKMGGSVAHRLTEVEIVCLPQDLPEFIPIDMTEMDAGTIIHLSEVPLPPGVELAHAPDPDVPVVIVYGRGSGAADEEGAGSS